MLNSKLKKILCLICIVSITFMSGCTYNDTKTVSEEKTEGEEKQEKEAGQDKEEKEALLYTKALSADDSEKPAYNLTEVRRGDFVHEMFAIGQIEYRDTYYQTLETESAKLVKYKVKEGDMVKKGDVILTYEQVFDEVSYAQRVADVNQQEKEYTAGYDSRRAEIVQAEHDLSELKDKTERDIKQLEIKKLKLALKKYQEMKVNIEEARKELNEYKAEFEATKVYADHDGYIMKLSAFKKGDVMGKGAVVAIISPKKDYLIKIEDLPEVELRYNADVTISIASDDGEVSFPGRVIMSSNILSYSNAQEAAYVEFNEKPADLPGGPIKVYFQSRSLKDVLLVDKNAVGFEKMGEGANIEEVPYVYVYENKMACKRYIEVFGNNNKDYLVLSGLNEGQQVAIYR